jgi:hypothetical protein
VSRSLFRLERARRRRAAAPFLCRPLANKGGISFAAVSTHRSPPARPAGPERRQLSRPPAVVNWSRPPRGRAPRPKQASTRAACFAASQRGALTLEDRPASAAPHRLVRSASAATAKNVAPRRQHFRAGTHFRVGISWRARNRSAAASRSPRSRPDRFGRPAARHQLN